MWKQLVQPDTSITMPAGWCLGLVQRVYGAPGLSNTAWEAWTKTTNKFYGQEMPPVSVPVWFDHYGTYDGVYGQFGHVVAWIPGRGFLSSPGSGTGQKWLGSIAEIERFYNSTYVGWTTDINTLQVAQYIPEEDDEMPNSQYFKALSDSKSGLVKKNDVWVRPAPGEALRYLTPGQAHDWFAMNGLDFNSPNVFGKEGGWFDLAFQEDKDAAKRTQDANNA